MNKFEAVLLISPEVSNNSLEQNIKNFQDIVTKSSGKITNTEDWGLRDLSYDINNFKKAFYKYFQIEIENVNSSTFQLIDEYIQNQALLDILENINSGGIEELNRISYDLITNDIDADFSRPVSDLYWLNQIKKTKKYKEILPKSKGIFRTYEEIQKKYGQGMALGSLESVFLCISLIFLWILVVFVFLCISNAFW